MIDRLAVASGRDVSRETFGKLEHFVGELLAENQRQNLISSATVDQVWERHILDGAQLLRFSGISQAWCDIGSGPGLPGLVLGIFGQPIHLIEPRKLRVDFLSRVIDELALDHVSVFQGKAERCVGQFDIVTARAVSALPSLFRLASHLTHSGTKWVLPKGQRAKSELDEAKRSWQGSFELVPSVTSPDASIVIAEGVRPRGKR